jgi:hypothetical protein
VQDNDFLDDAYFAPAIDAMKLQIKRGGVQLAMLIEACRGHAPRAFAERDAVGRRVTRLEMGGNSRQRTSNDSASTRRCGGSSLSDFGSGWRA